MVVIAAGRKKQGARQAPHHFVEAEALMVERRGAIEIAHVEMDMADDRAGRDARPALSARGFHQTVETTSCNRIRKCSWNDAYQRGDHIGA